jgi:hypothetical protein
MGSSGASRGGGSTFYEEWAPATAYTAGSWVTYDTGYGKGLYVTTDGAAADDAPVTSTILYSGTPSSVDTVDGDPYQFRCLFSSTKRVRLTGLCYFKTATQTEMPHELRLYDPTLSTAAHIASVTVPGEVAGATGQHIAPLIADILPSRNYSATLVTGVGVVETGYRYQTGFSFPTTAGSISMSAGGYSASHANITTIVSPTNYYAGVCPRWEEPSVNWTLVARLDSVIAGGDRDLYVPLRPS